MTNIREALHHRFGASGCIKNDVEEFPISRCLETIINVRRNLESMIDSDHLLAKGKPLGVHVEDRHLGASRLRKDRGRYSDRPGPHHGDAARRSRARALHAMGADGQELDHRRFIQPQADRRHDIPFRDRNVLAGPTVTMNAQHL